MHPILNEKKPDYQSAIDWLAKELSSLRTGRATPALVEDVSVKAYDSTMDLKSVASISAQDAQTLVIDPWDKSLLQAIEKAIRDADLGVSPAIDGEILRINMPPMTEDNRKALVKKMKEMVEESRVRVRSVREAVREDVMKQEKDKTISEDEKYKLFDEIEKLTKDYTAQIDEMAKKKEDEVMTV